MKANGPEKDLDLYTSIFSIFSNIYIAKDSYEINFNSHKKTLLKAYDLSQKSFEQTQNPHLINILAFYWGQLAESNDFSQLLGHRLNKNLELKDPENRAITLWALLKMEVYIKDLNKILLKHIFNSEDHFQNHLLLNFVSMQSSNLDILQKLLRVKSQ